MADTYDIITDPGLDLKKISIHKLGVMDSEIAEWLADVDVFLSATSEYQDAPAWRWLASRHDAAEERRLAIVAEIASREPQDAAEWVVVLAMRARATASRAACRHPGQIRLRKAAPV
jgi:hypothetical protein